MLMHIASNRSPTSFFHQFVFNIEETFQVYRLNFLHQKVPDLRIYKLVGRDDELMSSATLTYNDPKAAGTPHPQQREGPHTTSPQHTLGRTKR